MIAKIRRYYHTVRWLRPGQFGYRLVFAVKRRTDPALFPLIRDRALRKEGEFRLTNLPRSAVQVRRPSSTDWLPDDIIEGRLHFANRTKTFAGAPDWNRHTHEERTWTYNLHYFDFAPPLAESYLATGDQTYLDCLTSLIRSWIAACPPAPSLPWDGGPLSRRIMNWCRAAIMLRDAIGTDPAFRSELQQSLFTQALYLERHIERHLCGNHVVTNGAALLFAGTLLEGHAPRRWRDLGLRILMEELSEQILPDGGHYERSPMYHCIVMQDYLDCLRLMRAAGTKEPAEFRQALLRMSDFLSAILHPDGTIPLLNDSVMGLSDSPKSILQESQELLDWRAPSAGVPHVQELPHTGYFLCRPAVGDLLIFDAGPVGPDHNPGHAHSDTLGFELSLAGQRVLVDSGVYGYAADAWRVYCESTRAHNTVVIDGVEQTEKWGPAHFRAARRAKPTCLDWYEHEDLICFQGGHDGYRRLPGHPSHLRRILLLQRRYWVIYDEVWGGGVHLVESFLHFHPEFSLAPRGSGFLASNKNISLCVQPFGCEAVQVTPSEEAPIQGWHCPEFGVRLAQPLLHTMSNGPLPRRFGVLLAPGASACIIEANPQASGVSLTLTIDGQRLVASQHAGGRFHLQRQH